MKRNFIGVAAGLGFAQLALLATAAHAQDTSRVLHDVVIEATKIGEKQSQTGKVVTIITRQELERSSGKTVAELLNEQPDIIVNGAGGNPGLNKSVYLRGADNKYTLILLDGVLMSDPSGLGGAFDLRLLSVDQIDHIEILYGGQSTLYGSDAVAGVINIITKKQSQNGLNLNGTATGGSYGTFKGSIGLNSRIDKFSYNINYTHLRTDGVSEALRPPGSTAAHFDLDGNYQDALNTQFNIEATQRLQINPFIRYFYGNYKYDDGGYKDAPNTNFVKHLNTGANAIYTLDKGSLNLNYSFENTSRNYHDAYGNSPFKGQLNFVDFYFNHQIGRNVKILVGVDDRESKMNASGKSKLDSSANLFGAYGSVLLHDIGSVFNLEAGGRYNHQSNYGSNWTYSVTPSLNILPYNGLKLFGTVATSFKVPDLSALYGQYGANPNLKPEKAHNYEAGFSTQLFKNIFNLRVDVYERNAKDAIVYLSQGYINQDKQNAKGIEVEPSVNIGIVTLTGYYTYLKANTITKNATTGADEELDYLYRRPANTVGLKAGVQATKRLFVSVNFRDYSKRYDAYYNPDTYKTEIHLLNAYHLFDAYAEYKVLNRLKVFVDVKNVFNEKYAELYGYTALGTNFNAGLSFNIHR